jgi:hypothetical protein
VVAVVVVVVAVVGGVAVSVAGAVGGGDCHCYSNTRMQYIIDG